VRYLNGILFFLFILVLLRKCAHYSTDFGNRCESTWEITPIRFKILPSLAHTQ